VVDPEVPLSQIANSPVKCDPRTLPISFGWVMVDGVSIEGRPIRNRIGMPTILDKDRPFPEGGVAVVEPKKIYSDTVELPSCLGETLSPDFLAYFEHITAMFESDDDEIQQSWMSSLSTDAGIQPLLPLFLHFLGGTLTRGLGDTNVVRKVGFFTMALVQKPSLPIHFYAHAFLRTIFTVLLRYEHGQDVSDDIELRRGCASVLVAICRRCVGGFPAIEIAVVNGLIKGLFDPGTTHAAQLGALFGIRAMGKLALRRIVPHIRGYTSALKHELAFDDPTKRVFTGVIFREMAEILKETIHGLTRVEQQRWDLLLTEVVSTAAKCPPPS
jgi:hypothetical protein